MTNPKKRRETSGYRWLLVSTDAEAARAGTDRQTDRQDDPHACAPRVNNTEMGKVMHVLFLHNHYSSLMQKVVVWWWNGMECKIYVC